jgi:uncharacterized protein (DUF2147 family)
MMQYKIFMIFLSLVLFSPIVKAQNKADDIIGNWLTAGKDAAKIQVYKVGDKFYGKIVWLKNPTENGKPRVDANNPDNAKKNNPSIGLVMLTGFTFNGDDEWEGGDIYDPETGKTYSCYLSFKDNNTLKVRGYVGISLFGRTEVWTRTN